MTKEEVITAVATHGFTITYDSAGRYGFTGFFPQYYYNTIIAYGTGTMSVVVYDTNNVAISHVILNLLTER